jgi:hypothetical protein
LKTDLNIVAKSEALLNEPVLNMALENMENELLVAWTGSAKQNAEYREELFKRYLAVLSVKQSLKNNIKKANIEFNTKK